jgi:hypothetical protein
MADIKARMRRIFSRKNLPRSRWARIAIGLLLALGGFVGFLPILGFWMVPMGLTVLAIDIPIVRRFTRRAKVVLTRWWRRVRGHKKAAARKKAAVRQPTPKKSTPKKSGPKKAH